MTRNPALEEAQHAVTMGHCMRICQPGEWVVWRDANGTVHTEHMGWRHD